MATTLPAKIETTTTSEPPAELAALAELSSERLRTALVKSLARTAAELKRLAWIVRILEERGEDLTDLRIGLLTYLRQIAYGRLAPEALVRFADSTSLMNVVAGLPVHEQEQLAAGEPVKLVVRRPDGSNDVRLADPLKMTRDQIGQAFGRGKIRDEAEQILILEDRATKPIAGDKRGAVKVGKVRADRKRGGLVIGRTFVPAADVVAALATLAEYDTEPKRETQTMVLLTEDEHYALRRRALDNRQSMQDLIRRSLAAHGLLTKPEE